MKRMVDVMAEKGMLVSKLVKDSTEMITACFDEYYFIIPETVIKPVPKNAGRFELGNDVPVSGDTYQFPKDFNIIDLHFKLVGMIREGKLFDVRHIDEYVYDAVPAVNMMGYGIRLNSEQEFDEFKQHFNSFSIMEREKLADFANKWFDIFKYRTVKYK